MIYGLYAIRDAKSTYMQIMEDVNDACAIRNFEHAVRQPDSLLASHPADYSLVKVGTYDNEAGLLDGFVPPVLLVDAASILVKE